MLTNYKLLFKEDEVIKEAEDHKLQAGLQRLRKAEMNRKRDLSRSTFENADFIVTIYIDDRAGDPITLQKNNRKTTAHDIFMYCILKKEIETENLSLYEIIGQNESERVVHPSELILDVIIKWNNRDNYLCIKQNTLIDLIKEFDVKSERSKKIPLYYKGKAKWKKYSCWFRDDKLIMKKEGKSLLGKRSDVSEEINLDYNLFIGLVHSDFNKAAPTKWGFWLHKESDSKYLCTDTEHDMYHFISTFINMKYKDSRGLQYIIIDQNGTCAGALSPRRQIQSQRLAKEYSWVTQSLDSESLS